MAPSRALLEYGANKEDRARLERAMKIESILLFFFFFLCYRNQELFNSEGNVYRSWGLYKLYKFRGGVFESLEGTRMGQFVWQGLSSMKFPSWENVAFSTVVWYTPGRRCRGGSFINDSLLFLPTPRLLDIFFSLLHYRLISIFRIAVATGCRATPLLTTIIPNQRGIPDRNS